MTLVVFGIDALDPSIVDAEDHPNLLLVESKAIGTIDSVTGAPSTHELWPTIITGLTPNEHGITLDEGVAWGNPLLNMGSRIADFLLPQKLQTRVGAWLLTNTGHDAFQTPATYFETNSIETVFDGRQAKPIGIPNYVVDEDYEDREHGLRQSMGALFERDETAIGGHRSADPIAFYNNCREMAMVRAARIRAAVRSREYELVFGYTSALDLVGHIAYQSPGMQRSFYEEMDSFVADIRSDLSDDDELLLVSDHGLKNGVHTDEAMVASTESSLIRSIEDVTGIKDSVERFLNEHDHRPLEHEFDISVEGGQEEVREHLEDLGYMG